MASPLPIDTSYLLDQLVALLNIPSPTGLAEPAVAYTEAALASLGLTPRRTYKGGLVAEWPGISGGSPRALTAHVDTLGAMVREIRPNGRLRLTPIGGLIWNSVECEGCRVITSAGKAIRGSLLAIKASGHIHGKEVGEVARGEETMEVRLDERTISADETRALGVQVGDFVAFDPRVEVSPNGFIRSRHLDDKAGVACILAGMQAMRTAAVEPAQPSFVHISNYEEVGHGAASGIPAEVVELVAVDMAPVGEGQASDEFHATLCAKDAGGPYHAGLSQRLRQLADRASIPHRVDTYPHYHSDGEAYWNAGGDVRLALIGPGIDASHNYERTHLEGLVATSQWIAEYLRSP